MDQRETREVLDEVAAEREHPDAKWGGPSHDDEHPRQVWLRLINTRVWSDTLEYRRKMVEIAALAVAAIEANDRGRR